MKILAESVRKRRRELGLSLDKVCDRTTFTKGYLSGIENDIYPTPPSRKVIAELEKVLQVEPGAWQAMADWSITPQSVKEMIRELGGLEPNFTTQGAAVRTAGGIAPGPQLKRVPVINRTAAGAPAGYTDLDYPVNVADEYVHAPLDDQRAFAAKITGDSMSPEYREGDTVVFSPATEPADGDDCFVRLGPQQNHEHTFKRIFPAGEGKLRLQPLNPAHEPRIVNRTDITGLWPAVAVLKKIRK